jgi:Beta-galactosidase
MRCLLTLFVVLPSQVIAEIPNGVFALIKGSAPTGPSVLSNPDVDGISLRTGWEDVNPSEDVYDWHYFDTEIQKATNAGKKVLIRVVEGGTNIPQWVLDASAAASEPTFSFYSSGVLITQPVFWAPTLLANKAKLMAAFGARYNANPTVAIVTCQFAGARDDDWGVPASTTVDGLPPEGSTQRSRWLAAGWTTAKMVDAGNQVVANAMAAFPNKPVGLAIGDTPTALTPEGQHYIGVTVINTARAKWGDRMVATHNSMSEKPPVPPPPAGGYWSTIYNMQPSVGGQMLWWSYAELTCRNAAGGAPCDAATVLTHSVERAHQYGWNYLEIYSADIVGLPSVIHYAHGLLTQSSPTLTGVVSRKTHGRAGDFDVDLPLTGRSGVECRSGGMTNDYTLVFTFHNNLASVAGASVSAHNPASGTCSVSSSSMGPNPNQYTVNLTGVTDAQYLTVTLNGALDFAGNSGNVVGSQMGVLVGDVNASGVVTVDDIDLCEAQALQPITGANFRNDINATGAITGGDVSAIRQNALSQLPP